MVAVCPGIINTPIIREGIMRGQVGDDQDKIAVFYDKHGASPDTVAEAVLDAIARPRGIVVSPPSQVLVPYLLHRLSSRLWRPLSRNVTKIVSHG